MADVKIVCEACGTENVFSEYTRPESRTCKNCGASLASQETSQRKNLKVSKHRYGDDLQPEKKPSDVQEIVAKAAHSDTVEGPEKGKDKGTERSVSSSLLLGVLAFLVIGGILVAGQYFGRENSDIRSIYRIARLVALGLAFVLIVFEAFMEGQIPGFLALLIPPYLIYYALACVDGFWKQGIFLAVVLMLGTELYFMQGDAILTHCDNFINSQIDFVGDQLEKAGNAPVPER